MTTPAPTLSRLLEAAFSPDELRDWLHDREGYLLFQALPRGDEALFTEAAETLLRRGHVDARFLADLRAQRPGLAARVVGLARELGLDLPDPGPVAGAALDRGQGLACPEPAFDDEALREGSHALEALFDAREQALIAGQPTADLDARILELRRRLRRGPQLQPGELLDQGRFKLIERVGQGGWGTVWRAYDRQQRELVAVKVLHGQWSGERSRRERFARGARAMARLRHPGVVRVRREPTEEGGFHFFVMELLRGGDLHQAVLAGAMPPRRCLEALRAVGEALAEAHEAGLVHRDVKPHNILLDSRGQARLTDFDLVKDFDYSGSHTGSAMGTYRYAAPELLEDAKSADARADVFGLAMTAAFCLAGRDPPREAALDPRPFLHSLRAGPGLLATLARALDHDPAARFPDMLEFVRELDKVWGEAGLEGESQPWHAPPALLLLDPGRRGALLCLSPDGRGEDARRAFERGVARHEALAADRHARRWVSEPEGRQGGGLRLRLPEGALEPWGGWVEPGEQAPRRRADAGSAARGEADWAAVVEDGLALVALAEDALAAGVDDLPLDGPALARVGGRPLLLHAVIAPGDEAGGVPARALVFRVGRRLRVDLAGGQAGDDPWQRELDGFPAPLRHLVFKATQADPDHRQADLPTLAAELRAARSGPGRPDLTVDVSSKGPSWPRWGAVAAAALALLALGPLFSLLQDRSLIDTRDRLQVAAEATRSEHARVSTRVASLNQEREALAGEALALEQHLRVLAPLAADAPALQELVDEREARLATLGDQAQALEQERAQALAREGALRADYDALPARFSAPPEALPALPAPPATARASAPRVVEGPAPPAAGWPRLQGVSGAPVTRFGVALTLPDFALGEPVSRGRYAEALWPRGSGVPRPGEPMAVTSVCDAARLANRLSRRDGLTPAHPGLPLQGCELPGGLAVDLGASGYRLPTAEELAAAAALGVAEGCAGAWTAEATEGERVICLARGVF